MIALLLAVLTFGWGAAVPAPGAPVECGSWLAVTAVVPGQASFEILPHDPQEFDHPYLVAYVCLHEPDHVCPGGEWMVWPDGVLSDHFDFHTPAGGPYQLIVAKYVFVCDDEEKEPPCPGRWVPTRACATVEMATP